MAHIRRGKGMQQDWVRVVFQRRLLIIVVLLIQIIFIFFLISGAGYVFRYADYVLNGVSILVCLYILNKQEKSAYKLTWIFLILLFPIFGGLVYVILHTQYNSRKLHQQTQKADKVYKPFFPLPGDALPQLSLKYRDCLPQVRYLQEYAGFPVYSHTRTEYFASGESFFERLMKELEKAENYVFMEFFILRMGVMLDPIIELLERKARQGLDIRIIYDDLGCFMSLPSNYKE
jgi:cardiolipin synthase